MGFLDKMKKAVGKTGVELTYSWIEDPFTFGDPMIKATVRVTATDGAATVLGTNAKFVAKRQGEEGEESMVLGQVSEEHDPHYKKERDGERVAVFPCTLHTGDSEGFGIFLDGLELKSSLGEWGVSDAASAMAKNIELVLETEVDIKETNFMFDPIIKQTITPR